jgi:hypothetical protein
LEEHRQVLGIDCQRFVVPSANELARLVLVAPEGLEEMSSIRAWVERGVGFVETLPPKDWRGGVVLKRFALSDIDPLLYLLSAGQPTTVH